MCKVTISEFEFLSKFDTEAKAVAFFESVRWKHGRTCPHCDNQNTYPHKNPSILLPLSWVPKTIYLQSEHHDACQSPSSEDVVVCNV